MKRRLSIYFLRAFVAVSMLSCQKGVDAGDMDAIVFCASEFDALVTTKATEVTTANLTSFYVTATRGTVGSSETATFTSATFTGTPGGTFSGGKWWPSSNPSYHFYGSSISNSFSSNACTVYATTANDVVCAYLESPNYKGTNTLTFNHIFARVGEVWVNAPSGYTLSGVTVRITPRVAGTYNIRTGNGRTDGTGWSGLSDGSQTVLSSANNNLYLIPGDYTLSVTYTLTKGDWTHEYTKNASVSLTAGVTNNVTMTPPTGTATEIVVGVSLTGWSSNDIAGSFS